MSKRIVIWGVLTFVALLLAAFGGLILLLPGSTGPASAPAIAAEEAAATLAALKPPKRQRPLVAIVGLNDATETTDYLMPFGILRRADVADVMTLATQLGPVQLLSLIHI